MELGRGLVAAVDGGIGRFVIGGVVTAPRAAVLLAHNDAWMTDKKLPSQVVDYSAAAMQIPPETLHQAARQVRLARPKGGFGAPTALIVPKDALETWRLYCWLMAQCGLLRAAFVDAEQGRRWAVSQAALWAAQKDHQRRGR